MLDQEKFSSKDRFKQTLEDLKEYILKLLKRRTEKVTEGTKDQVKEILEEQKPKPSLMDTLKNLFKWDEKESVPENKYEAHSEDRDEYIPQDSEFWESLGEPSRFAEVYPGFRGYFTSGKKSYFDRNTNLWSKKKRLEDLHLSPDVSQKSYAYAGIITASTVSIPLPEWSLPDIASLNYSWKTLPIFHRDQNNCIYITSKEKQYVSFKFHTDQILPVNLPVPEDSEKIVFDKLTRETRDLLDSLSGSSTTARASKIREYITRTKKYSTRLQGTLRDKSNNKNYISHLDKSEVLECFSANALFVALCREVWIPARLAVGHMVQSLDKEGKSLLSSNNRHAWSEIWDEKTGAWKRFDATPTVKEDGEESNQNMDGQDGVWDGQGWDSNMDKEGQGDWQEQSWSEKKEGKEWQQWKWGQDPKEQKEGEWKQRWKKEDSESRIAGSEWRAEGADPEKSPSEMLDELIKKAKDDNLLDQAERLKETIEKLEKAGTKEEIRDVLDKSGLTDFAKDMVDEIWNEEILKQEQEGLQNLEEEKEVDEVLEKSLLDDDFKSKLNEYAREIKKKIQEEKKKAQSEMQRMGFSEEETRLYKLYKELERELEGEVKKQIRALEKILPPKFHTINNDQEHFASGSRLWESWRLIEYELTGDQKVFRRDREVRESNEINMFETIVIDRSGSMGSFESPNSPLREAIKAAIIRAKVLEHFKVNFSIVIFDTEMEEVMEFGEKFSDRKRNNIPSRLMRAVMKSGGTDIGQPLTYTLESMKRYARKNGMKSFGNISFLGDGEPTNGLRDSWLKALITEIRKSGFGLTAYYINGSSQRMDGLESYFGSKESGGTVTVPNVKELTDKLIGAYNENLRKVIKKYMKN